MPHEAYIDIALREFRRLKRLGDEATAQVADANFFARLDGLDNSVGVVVKHMAGNLRSRWRDFLTSDGEKPDRDRDGEFELTAEDTREALMRSWEAGWGFLFDALEPMGDDDLARTVTIRDEPLTVLQAVNRQLTHYAYHTGQLVLLAKHFAGDRWKSLSVPRGGSVDFNSNPTSYLDEDAT